MDYPRFVSVVKMDDKVQRFQSQLDTVEQKFVFSLSRDTARKYTFHYEQTGKDLKLDGVLFGDTLSIDLKYYDLENMGLLNRGFNWVNEVPYNRYNYD